MASASTVPAAPAPAGPDSAPSTVAWPQIVLFGDSLTQFSFGPEGCWGALLADALQRKCDVLNRGFSGYNSRAARVLLPRILPPQMSTGTQVVTVFLGANDSNGPASKQHVPLDEFRFNMQAIVEYLLAVGIPRDRILLIDNPASDDDKWNEICLNRNGYKGLKDNKLSGQYAHATVELARRLGVGHIDLYDSMMADSGWRSMLNDGLHLSRRGGEFLLGLLLPWIQERTQNLPTLLPTWDVLDWQDVSRTLAPGGTAMNNDTKKS